MQTMDTAWNMRFGPRRREEDRLAEVRDEARMALRREIWRDALAALLGACGLGLALYYLATRAGAPRYMALRVDAMALIAYAIATLVYMHLLFQPRLDAIWARYREGMEAARKKWPAWF